MQKVDLHTIISSGSFYDGLINLNKFFRITGSIILINVTHLELGWPPDFSKRSHQSAKSTPSSWVMSLARDRRGGLGILTLRRL
jgi:hypothetical protein